MRKKIIASILASLFLIGCDGSTSVSLADELGGVSTLKDNIGELSNDKRKSLKELLKDGSFKTISLDIKKLSYYSTSQERVYKADITFSNNQVKVLANCKIIEARYRVSNEQLEFFNISTPKPAIDYPTCEESHRAEDAVSAFMSYSDYTLIKGKSNKIELQATDVDTKVTLKN